MRAALQIAVGLFIAVDIAGVVAAADDEPSEGRWRTLPLITDGEVDPAWVHTGWGGFVVDGEALRTECDEKGMGLLVYSKERFGDCQIRVVFKSKDPKSNAGVYVRIDDGILDTVKHKPQAVRRNNDGSLAEGSLAKLMEASEKELGPWYAVHHGYEVQICDQADELHRTGAIYSLAKASPAPKKRADEWKTMVITLQGNLVLVEIDGTPVTRFDPESKDTGHERKWFEPKREPKRPQAGYVGLQNHDPGDVVSFKEVSVRSLPGDAK